VKTLITKFAIGIVLIIALVGVHPRVGTAESDAQPSAPPTIRIAPLAPIFDNQTRLAELAARRARVAEAVGANGVLILFSTEPRVYANDVD
jgi:hypothetical protein